MSREGGHSGPTVPMGPHGGMRRWASRNADMGNAPIAAPPPGGHDRVMGSLDPVRPLGGVWLRWSVWRRRRRLDDDLAGGVDPLLSDALSLRTGQLRSQKSRASMGRSLLAALDLAGRQPTAAPALAPLIRRREVLACTELIAALAARISDEPNPGVRGLAIASRLIHDRRSPLYLERASRPLDTTLRCAIAAVCDSSTPTPAPPRIERSTHDDH